MRANLVREARDRAVFAFHRGTKAACDAIEAKKHRLPQEPLASSAEMMMTTKFGLRLP
ncbi:MAG TPA: hypothetical protein VGP76_25865 [Planctomycetaceae bacterium]|jgi:hypothetical protein|nr:hypothetical protein [Planctomycetaceae bacterium]